MYVIFDEVSWELGHEKANFWTKGCFLAQALIYLAYPYTLSRAGGGSQPTPLLGLAVRLLPQA